jgi:hypothetical protein
VGGALQHGQRAGRALDGAEGDLAVGGCRALDEAAVERAGDVQHGRRHPREGEARRQPARRARRDGDPGGQAALRQGQAAVAARDALAEQVLHRPGAVGMAGHGDAPRIHPPRERIAGGGVAAEQLVHSEDAVEQPGDGIRGVERGGGQCRPAAGIAPERVVRAGVLQVQRDISRPGQRAAEIAQPVAGPAEAGTDDHRRARAGAVGQAEEDRKVAAAGGSRQTWRSGARAALAAKGAVARAARRVRRVIMGGTRGGWRVLRGRFPHPNQPAHGAAALARLRRPTPLASDAPHAGEGGPPALLTPASCRR